MASLSNINNVLRTGSLGVGINRDPLGAFEISSATKPGVKMFNTATNGKTYEAYSDVNGNYIIYDQDADSNRLTISSAGNATFTGDVQAPGIYVGATNASFDFYNQGTSYFNGAVTVDAAFTQSGGAASTFSGNGTFGTVLNVIAPDNGGSPAMTSTINMHGYDGRGVGIKMKDNVTTSGGGTDREWFIGTGYNQSGFNIGYASDGSQSSYAAQAKLAITTGGNVGIGSTSPQTKFVVQHTDGGTGVEFSMGASLSYIQCYNRTSSDYIALKIDAEDLRFGTNDGSERMRIDNSGNVGIGTTSSTERVTIAGVGSLYPNIKFTFPGVTSRFMKIGMVSAVKYEFHVNGSGTYMSFATEGTEKMRITSSAEGHVELSGTAPVIKATASNGGSGLRINVAAQSGGQLFRVQEDGSTKFTVTESGNVEVGVANSTSNGAILYGGTAGGIIYSFRDANSPGSVFRWYTGGTMVGSVSTTSSATSFNTSSDYRLKENVIKMTGALDRVSQLKPSRFNFIIDPNKTVDGFLAHEVQNIVPEAITGEKDAVDEEGNPDYQGIDQSKLVPLLVGAIQELKAEIELLKNK
jgi:hypothetical protein